MQVVLRAGQSVQCVSAVHHVFDVKSVLRIFPNYFFSISSALGAEILTEIFDNFCSAVVVAAPEHHVDGELRSSTSMYYAWTRAMSFFKSTTET